MNQTQIAAVYDSMTPEEQNMPRDRFIRQCMDVMNPKANTKILDHMVQRKRQATQGRIQKAQIDAALRERR